MRALRPKVSEEQEDSLLLSQEAVVTARALPPVNLRGLWTLTVKETKRYLKIWMQTLLSPLIMTFLFYAVFVVSSGTATPRVMGGAPFLHFLIPGLVMMAVAQSAFISPAISLILSKLQGNIVDLLMAPVSPMEVAIAYSVSGMLRGLIVGGLTLGFLMLVSDIRIQHPALAIYFAVMASLMLSLMGLLTGILSSSFDHLGAIQNFIITPATFLSGTFFSAQQLPEAWRVVCFVNPFYYMIDGFRFAFLGTSDILPIAGMGLLAIICLVLFTIAYWLLAKGTRMKS